MEKILKAKLYKRSLVHDLFDYNAQVISHGEVEISEIVDELLEDNPQYNREDAIQLIMKFNQQAAKMVASGYHVNTGLVNISPVIKGPFVEKKWSARLNRIETVLTYGSEISKALSETCIELYDEPNELLGLINPSEEMKKMRENPTYNDVSSYNQSTFKEPACGIAFRRWLCEA